MLRVEPCSLGENRVCILGEGNFGYPVYMAGICVCMEGYGLPSCAYRPRLRCARIYLGLGHLSPFL